MEYGGIKTFIATGKNGLSLALCSTDRIKIAIDFIVYCMEYLYDEGQGEILIVDGHTEKKIGFVAEGRYFILDRECTFYDIGGLLHGYLSKYFNM